MRTIEQMVQQEIMCCMSSLVSMIASGADAIRTGRDSNDLVNLAGQANDLCRPLEDYEEAATQAGWIQYKKGDAVTPPDEEQPWWYEGLHADQDWFNTAQEVCWDRGIDPYEWEVFEHWAVSTWFAERLIEQGEKVDTDFGALNIWARTTTGQAISMDGVIQKIYAKMMEPVA